MTRAQFLTQHDIKFQFRQGFYIVYGIVTLIYIVLLNLLSTNLRNTLGPIILLSDPSFLGFFFIGAILYYEKEQRVTSALFVTPVSYGEYLIGKILSLTLLSLVVTVVISLFSFGIFINWIPLIVGIFLTASLFTTMGIGMSLKFTKVTTYLIFGGFSLGPFALPIVYYLGFLTSWTWIRFIPSYSSLLLINGGINRNRSILDMLLSVLYLLVWNIILFVMVKKKGEEYAN